MPTPVSLTEISTEPSACLAFNPDPSSLRGELDGVGKQVEKDLLDLALVAGDVAQPFVDGNVERDAVLGGALPHEGARVVDG